MRWAQKSVLLCETNQSSISACFRSVISNPDPWGPLSCRYFSFLCFKHLFWMNGWLAEFYRAWGHTEKVIRSLNQKYCIEEITKTCRTVAPSGWEMDSVSDNLNEWNGVKHKSTKLKEHNSSCWHFTRRLRGKACGRHHNLVCILSWTKPYQKPWVNQTHWFRGIITFRSN